MSGLIPGEAFAAALAFETFAGHLDGGLEKFAVFGAFGLEFAFEFADALFVSI